MTIPQIEALRQVIAQALEQRSRLAITYFGKQPLWPRLPAQTHQFPDAVAVEIGNGKKIHRDAVLVKDHGTEARIGLHVVDVGMAS